MQRRVLKYAVQQRPRTERRFKKAVRTYLLSIGREAAAAVEAQTKTGAWRRTEILSAVSKAVEPSAGDLHATLQPVIEGELMAYNLDLATLFGVAEEASTFAPGTGARPVNTLKDLASFAVRNSCEYLATSFMA